MSNASAARSQGILGVTRDIQSRKTEEEGFYNALAKFKALFDSSRDGIIYTGMNGAILDANEAYLEMLGYSLEEIKALRYHELTPPKWAEIEKEVLKNQIVKRGYSDEYEKEYIRKDGTIIPIAIRVWLIRDSKNLPVGFWGVVRDITTRKEIEEQLVRSENRLKLITENTSDLITICNLDGTVTFTSPSYSKLYYSEYDLMGKVYFDYLKPDDQEELMNFLEGAILDEQFKVATYFEYYIKDKVGKWHLLESSLNVTKTQEGHGSLVIVSRLSTKKRKTTKRGGSSSKNKKKK